MCWASPVFHSLTNFHKRFDSFFSSPPYLTPPSFFLPFTRLSTSSEGLLLPSSSFSPRPPPYGLVGYSTSKFNSKTGFFLPIALLSSVIIRGIWGTFACSHTHLHTPSHLEMNAVSVHCDLEKGILSSWCSWCGPSVCILYMLLNYLDVISISSPISIHIAQAQCKGNFASWPRKKTCISNELAIHFEFKSTDLYLQYNTCIGWRYLLFVCHILSL